LLCAAYAAGAVLVCVAVDRALAQVLFRHPGHFVPVYRTSYHPTVGDKLEQLRDGRRPDALFLGNSLTMLDVDPERFDARLAERGIELDSYNAAFPTVGVQFWRRFLDSYFDDRPPRVVLLGVQPRDFTATGAALTAPLTERFYASNAHASRELGRVERLAEEELADLYVLWGRRGDFFSVLQGLRAGSRFNPDDIRVANDAGWSVVDPQFVRSRDELAAGAARLRDRHGQTGFQLAPEAGVGLDELVAWTNEHGARLVLFTMPVLYDSEPEGTVEIRRGFARALRAYAGGTDGVSFLDLASRLESSYGVADYVDENHLNEAGAAAFSAELADAVEELLRRG
jgi:hypothetical protein